MWHASRGISLVSVSKTGCIPVPHIPTHPDFRGGDECGPRPRAPSCEDSPLHIFHRFPGIGALERPRSWTYKPSDEPDITIHAPKRRRTRSQVIMGSALGRVSRREDKQSSDQISFQDYLGLCDVMYEWSASYDTKDWDRLRRCIAPTVRVSRPDSPPSTSQAGTRADPGAFSRSTTARSWTRSGRRCRPTSTSP